MAISLEMTPIDEELSKLPLPLLPAAGGGKMDWHHHAHPAMDPALRDSEGGIAVRNSRIQLADAHGNHRYYHDTYYGPLLPTTPEEQFAYVIWTSAGYIPKEGIDFPNGRPIKKILTDEQKRQLREGGIKPDKDIRVRRFIRNFIATQDLSSLPEEKIEEFLFARRKVQRAEAGAWILQRVVENTTDPLTSMYKRAHRAELLSPDINPKLSSFVLELCGGRFENTSMLSKFRTYLGDVALQMEVKTELLPINIAAA